MNHSLERALHRFRQNPADGVRSDVSTRVSNAAFRASVSERLRNVERELGDVKNRVNGLIFLVAGTVITQLLTKVLA